MNTNGIVLGTWVLFASSAAIQWLAFQERSIPWRVTYTILGMAALLLAIQGAMKM